MFCCNANSEKLSLSGSHAFVNKKFHTFSIPKFAQNKLSSSHLKYKKLQLFQHNPKNNSTELNYYMDEDK